MRFLATTSIVVLLFVYNLIPQPAGADIFGLGLFNGLMIGYCAMIFNSELNFK